MVASRPLLKLQWSITVSSRKSPSSAALSAALKERSARIGVLGLGYVGLPLAMEFCRKGFRVDGFDVSVKRVGQLKKGDSYVSDVASADVRRHASEGRFHAHTRFESLSRQDVIFVCVQTPLRKTKEPDIGNIISAVREIARHPRPGRLIVLESTTFPGTTDEVVLPLLSESGKLGKDFFLAFSPERVDPGNERYTIANTPKVVGGCTPESTALAAQAYAHICEKVVPVSSTRAAEVVKLLENSFRAANIALVNEMAQICHRLGLDVWEVIGAAATKPFGFMPFFPGPGIGGHCIPKDPQLLTWKMKTLNYEPRFISLAAAINGSMPEYTVARISAALNAAGKPLKGSKILVLGVAYKPNVSDFRESPALDVMERLLEAEAKVSYHDPYVPEVSVGGRTLRTSPLSRAALAGADCVAILTAHRKIDYGAAVRSSKLVFDARNATAGSRDAKVHRL
jgi:UDP-N-acetyl-D-glucosamine dehydrogenase